MKCKNPNVFIAGWMSLIRSARIVVRDIGFVAQLLEDGRPRMLLSEEHRHKIMEAYDSACAHLIQLDPAGAAEFIRSTYGPAFRQTEVTK